MKKFYLANQNIGIWQNAWALVGDYLSAAAFLGSIAMYFAFGLDSLFYAVATLISWPLLLILFSDKLRSANAYTLSGILQQNYQSRRLSLLSGSTSLVINIFYLLVQMIGAGALLNALFGLSYPVALLFISLLTLSLVLLGGMRAITIVQAIKALLLFIFAIILVILVLNYFDFVIYDLWNRVSLISQNTAFRPSHMLSSGLEQLSLVLGLLLGLLGLPHIAMRFFTVKNEKTAIYSAAMATGLIALFFTFNLIIGFGAYVILFAEKATLNSHMILLYLTKALGGEFLVWAFALLVLMTIVAVMAGLLIAASANISQDLLPLFSKTLPNNIWSVRVILLFLLLISGSLAYIFKGLNLAFLFGIAFAWAASVHFPVIFATFFVPSFNEKAAFSTLLLTAITSTLFITTSDTVWVEIFHFETALHPYRSPTLFILPLSALSIYYFRRRS